MLREWFAWIWHLWCRFALLCFREPRQRTPAETAVDVHRFHDLDNSQHKAYFHDLENSQYEAYSASRWQVWRHIRGLRGPRLTYLLSLIDKNIYVLQPQIHASQFCCSQFTFCHSARRRNSKSQGKPRQSCSCHYFNFAFSYDLS